MGRCGRCACVQCVWNLQVLRSSAHTTLFTKLPGVWSHGFGLQHFKQADLVEGHFACCPLLRCLTPQIADLDALPAQLNGDSTKLANVPSLRGLDQRARSSRGALPLTLHKYLATTSKPRCRTLGREFSQFTAREIDRFWSSSRTLMPFLHFAGLEGAINFVMPRDRMTTEVPTSSMTLAEKMARYFRSFLQQGKYMIQ